ncbi:hypothetical protein DPX16_8001 [Anabarilius grahami]|uniref:Uncharacterized protein n=1 Tax=Anabarilius grahami TaxID=495550 RepID=A0A3N0Z3H9_ANAGA|nr:hypothetical protein DPX16_8001 [Anabarilius grahami]
MEFTSRNKKAKDEKEDWMDGWVGLGIEEREGERTASHCAGQALYPHRRHPTQEGGGLADEWLWKELNFRNFLVNQVHLPVYAVSLLEPTYEERERTLSSRFSLTLKCIEGFLLCHPLDSSK